VAPQLAVRSMVLGFGFFLRSSIGPLFFVSQCEQVTSVNHSLSCLQILKFPREKVTNNTGVRKSKTPAKNFAIFSANLASLRFVTFRAKVFF
jgi:hypothetical protein